MPRKPKGHRDENLSAEKVQRGLFYTPNDAPWGGFINMRLDDQQKTQFFDWFGGNSETVSSYVDDLLGEGAKLSLSFDIEHSAYIVTLTGALVAKSNERYASTSRAGTLVEALGLTVWKHFFLCEGDYGNYKPSNSQFMTWG